MAIISCIILICLQLVDWHLIVIWVNYNGFFRKKKVYITKVFKYLGYVAMLIPGVVIFPIILLFILD